jgi:hypothetical protein
MPMPPVPMQATPGRSLADSFANADDANVTGTNSGAAPAAPPATAAPRNRRRDACRPPAMPEPS